MRLTKPLFPFFFTKFKLGFFFLTAGIESKFGHNKTVFYFDVLLAINFLFIILQYIWVLKHLSATIYLVGNNLATNLLCN